MIVIVEAKAVVKVKGDVCMRMCMCSVVRYVVKTLRRAYANKDAPQPTASQPVIVRLAMYLFCTSSLLLILSSSSSSSLQVNLDKNFS